MTRILLVTIACLLGVPGLTNAAGVNDSNAPGWQRAALRGIDLTLNEEFDRAFALYDSLERAHPRRPEGPLGKAMVLYNRGLLLKSGNDVWKQALDHLDRGVERAEDWVNDHGESAEMYFWLGSAYALKASLHVYQDDMIDAVVAGLESRDFLKASVERDSTYLDARFGLAFTEYMAARQPPFLKFVARLFDFPSGDRVGSLAQIDRVAREGVYTKAIARTTRAYLELYFERRPRSALEMFRRLRSLYPHSIDCRVRVLDCKLALTVTGKADFASELADSARAVRQLSEKRGLELDDWMRTKLLFVTGYGRYLQERYPEAREEMEAYLSQAHRKSWIRGPSLLVLGKIADLGGDREQARRHYEAVLDAEDVWGTHDEAEDYLETPFEGDEARQRPMDTETRYPQNP